MRVTTDEYLQHVVDQVAFKVHVVAQVEETNQIYNDEDDFRLRRPDLVLEVSMGQLGHPELTHTMGL